MAHSESQLETWSHQGSKTQSAETYETIKRTLEDRNAPFASRSFEIFLQGSYGNDTNIYSDSDVDIVICLTSVYYTDLTNLDTSQRSLYDSLFTPASYSWRQFREEVLGWLKEKFGKAVVDGNKAIFIPRSGSRRDADVLVCAEHRRYASYRVAYSNDYHTGVVFWDKRGTEIVNFPKQHRENCTDKHQNTNFGFKPNVRVLKNYRNFMIESGRLIDGVAPSYFLEGLLWNMPLSLFEWTHQGTISNFVDWIGTTDPSQLTCANGLHWLVRDGRPNSWPAADFWSYVTAVRSDW